MKRILLGVVLAGAVGIPAWAQEAKKPDEAPLAGRPVSTEPDKSTLVSRDFQGVIRLPEPTIVEAAVKALKLEGDEKDKVDAVLRARAIVLDQFVEQNLGLLTRFGNAEHSTDGKEKFLLAVEAFSKLEPLREKGPLDKQVKAAMSDSHGKEFDGLLRAYWDALAADDAKLPKPKGRIGVVMDAKLK